MELQFLCVVGLNNEIQPCVLGPTTDLDCIFCNANTLNAYHACIVT